MGMDQKLGGVVTKTPSKMKMVTTKMNAGGSTKSNKYVGGFKDGASASKLKTTGAKKMGKK